MYSNNSDFGAVLGDSFSRDCIAQTSSIPSNRIHAAHSKACGALTPPSGEGSAGRKGNGIGKKKQMRRSFSETMLCC